MSIILNGEWFAAESKPENAEQDSSDSEEDESTSHASSLQKLDESQQHQFILSDLNTKHRFAGETEELAVLWVKTLTAVLRSLYQKESNGTNDPEFVGAAARSPEQIKKDYESRVENYKRSQRQQTLVKMQGLKKNMDRKTIEKQISKQEKQWEEDAHRVARKSMFVDLQSDELEQARKALEEQRREAELAREEAERLKQELAKDQEVIAQQEDKIKGLEGMMDQLRQEAEARREQRKAEFARTEDKLKGLVTKRRNTIRHKDFDEAQYLQEIEALRGKLKALQSQLNVDYDNLDWDGTLEQAEEKMKELMPKMMSENEKEQQEAQQEFDQWDQLIRNHKDYQDREAKKWDSWAEENREKNRDALNEMRDIAPSSIMEKITLDDLVKKGMLKKTAKRVLATKAFHFFYMPKETIAKIHIADLLGRYAVMNFDIREMRALYACLPEEFTQDPDGRKAQIRDRLYEMTEKEKNGKLMPNEELHNAYREKAVRKAVKIDKSKMPKRKKVEMNAKTAALAQMLAERLGAPTAGDTLPPNDPKWKKYIRMTKAGLPQGAVYQAMKKDGISPNGYDAALKAAGVEFKDGGGGGGGGGGAAAAVATGKPKATAKSSAGGGGGKGVPKPVELPKKRKQKQKQKKPTTVLDRRSVKQGKKPLQQPKQKLERAPEVDESKMTGMLSTILNLVTGGAEEEGGDSAKNGEGGTDDAKEQKVEETGKSTKGTKKRGGNGKGKEKKPSPETLKKRQLRDPNAPILAKGTNALVNETNNEFSDIKLEKGPTAARFDEYGGNRTQPRKSEARAVKIGKKVEKSLDELIEVIIEHGEFDASQGGQATITFGELFDLYEKINDMLVGLLYKGKRKKRIKYKGDMLFKGIHDGIKITAL